MTKFNKRIYSTKTIEVKDLEIEKAIQLKQAYESDK